MRDPGNGEVRGLTNVTFVADLWQIGSRADSDAQGPATGPLDFSRDGGALVVTIYDDPERPGRVVMSATALDRVM